MALLTQMQVDYRELVDGSSLYLLTHFCLKERHANLAQAVLDVALEVLPEDQLAIYNPAAAGDSIAKARSGDYAAVAALGYVGDEAEPKVKFDTTVTQGQ
jgi:hypothetical protein